MTINSYKLTADVQSYLDTVYAAMERDETYEEAKARAHTAYGMILGMIAVLNATRDGNEEFEAMTDEWMREMYQHLITKCRVTEQPDEEFIALCKKRDEYPL